MPFSMMQSEARQHTTSMTAVEHGRLYTLAVLNGRRDCRQRDRLGHTYITLKSLHWLKVNERTYKVRTTTQSSNLHNLISLQPPRSTRSSSVVTLSRPPTVLKITDRSFRYASPRLWNQLPKSFCQPHQSSLDSHLLVSSSLSLSSLSSSIISSLFYSRLKTYLFNKSFPPKTYFTYWTAFMIMGMYVYVTLINIFLVLHFNFFVYPVW